MTRIISYLGLAMILLSISCSTEPTTVFEIPDTEESVPDESEPDEAEEEDSDSGDGDSTDEETDGDSNSETFFWTVYNMENSPLPTDKIIDIEFDSKGKAWFALNYNGFAEFDGTNWVIYNGDNSNTYDDNIKDIAIDDYDSKWIVAGNGFHWLNNGEWMHWDSTDFSVPSNKLLCVAVDQEDYKWIGTERGLLRYRGGDWTLYNNENSILTSNMVGAINVDENNVVWVTTEQELISIDAGNFKVYSYPSNLQSQNSSIAFRNNEVWFVADFGIGSLINGELTFYNYFEENTCLTDCQIREIHFRNDVLWLANGTECSSGGIQNYDECNLYNIDNSDLPNDIIYTFKFDSEGNAWIGTDSGLAIMKFE